MQLSEGVGRGRGFRGKPSYRRRHEFFDRHRLQSSESSLEITTAQISHTSRVLDNLRRQPVSLFVRRKIGIISIYVRFKPPKMWDPAAGAERSVLGEDNDLSSLFRFVAPSKLHAYLSIKAPKHVTLENHCYTLYQVSTALKEVIAREKLYDNRNPSVVICGHDLEEVVQMKAFHLSEVRNQVLKQMRPLVVGPGYQAPPAEVSRTNSTPSAEGTSSSPSLIGTTGLPLLDAEQKFSVTPGFMKLLRQLEGVDSSQAVFSYREVTTYLSQYILNNKTRLFDERNPSVVLCEGDALGEAFGVSAFHRSQATTLLKNQLLPPEESSNPPSSNCSPSTSQEQARKRSRAEDRQNRRRAKRSRAISLTISVDYSTSSGEETICSAQGYETVRADELDEDDASSSSDESMQVRSSDSSSQQGRGSSDGEDDANSENGDESTSVETVDDEEDDGASVRSFEVENIYRIEYEPGSNTDSDPEDGSGGRAFRRRINNDGSNSDDDSDIDEDVVIVTSAILSLSDQQTDFADWADSSSDSDSEDFALENYDEETGSEVWKCLECEQPNPPLMRYCHRCWQRRKGWVPERPKPRRRRRRSNAANTSSAEGPATTRPTRRAPSSASSGDEAPRRGSSSEPKPGDSKRQDMCLVESDNGPEGPAGRGGVDDGHRRDVRSGEAVVVVVAGCSGVDSGVSSSLESQELDPACSLSSSLQMMRSISIKSEASSGDTSDSLCRRRGAAVSAAAAAAASTSAPHPATKREKFSPQSTSLCTFCCVRPKDACFVHGKISHQVCCYCCAKRLFKRKNSCPVCRRKIEKITRNILS